MRKARLKLQIQTKPNQKQIRLQIKLQRKVLKIRKASKENFHTKMVCIMEQEKVTKET